MYHISADGNPKFCRAKSENCPFRGEHFPTKDSARRSFERKMKATSLLSFVFSDFEEKLLSNSVHLSKGQKNSENTQEDLLAEILLNNNFKLESPEKLNLSERKY